MNVIEEKFLKRLNDLFDSDPRTDSAIADALGVSKQTVSYWRQGTRSPRRSLIVTIAGMYHVSPSWLMGFDDDKKVDFDNPSIPKTLEARIVSFGMDNLPESERQKILVLLQVMYNNNPDLFKRSVSNDDS
jgi:transcriptional regulator with XRE-family HTH domain